jgi:ferredoxin, 2Fe-2S
MKTTITIHLIATNPIDHSGIDSFELKIGQSLMQGAVRAGIEGIAADCGGSLTCATCHIYVDDAWLDKLSAPSADELSMLDLTASPRLPNSRLSCQLVASAALEGLRISLPQTQY